MVDEPTSDDLHDDGPTAEEPGRAAPTGEGRVVREVELPTTTDAAWDALTDATEVTAWFGAELSWDLRPGGSILVGEGDDGSVPRRGEVDEVAPGRRLRFRWWPSDRRDDGPGDPGASVVTYDLEQVPGGTRLVVTEEPLGVPTTATATATVAWDTRLLGLWLGSRAGSLVCA